MGLCGAKHALNQYKEEDGSAGGYVTPQASHKSQATSAVSVQGDERGRSGSDASAFTNQISERTCHEGFYADEGEDVYDQTGERSPRVGHCASLADVSYENARRRTRLIHDTWGSVDDYYVLEKNKLGQGSFGYVCLARSRETGADRAVKSMSKARAKETRKRYRQEILIMKMLDHPNIVKLFETFEDKQHVFLVLELCTGGDLYHRLQDVTRFKEKEVAVIMQQLLRPVYYMHEKGICHRDIKPENFLFLTKDPIRDNVLKLIDFGFSCLVKPGQILTTKLGTARYSSPQVLAGQYDESCDVWALGCLQYVLLCGQPPFQGRSDAEVMQAVKRGNYAFQGPIWERISDDAKDLIRKQLKYQPQERWQAGQALHHSFIRNMAGEAPGGMGELLLPSLIMDLRFFCSQSLFRRAALQVVAQQLSQEDTKAFRRAFTALDFRGAGVLKVAELSETVLNYDTIADIRPELEQVVTELGPAEDGAEIGFTDFLAATLEARHYLAEGPARAAFRAFDRDGDGRISAVELGEVLFGKGADAQELLMQADANGDGVIDFPEFQSMLRGEDNAFPLDIR